MAECNASPLNIDEPYRPVATEEKSYYANETSMPAYTCMASYFAVKVLLDNFAVCESAGEANEKTINGKKFTNSTRRNLYLL